jgi:HlyD family secretion protein
MKLALIDDSLYRYDRDQAAAQLDQAKADILIAEAELEQSMTKFRQAEREWKRTQKAGVRDAVSETDYDSVLAAYESAKAGVSVAKAKVVQSEKAAVKAESVLKRAQQNLEYCTIVSPVNGVIIDRRVNIGQTVVSSMSAPSLFLIARDLKKLQIWVAVNEADISYIRSGQTVTFTVDAFPGVTFRGETGKIRLNAAMTQNVVTYTVEVNTDNSDGRLLPYLSASVKFLINSRKDVYYVPNAALRWTPNEDDIHPDIRKDRSKDRNGSAEKENGAGTKASGAVDEKTDKVRKPDEGNRQDAASHIHKPDEGRDSEKRTVWFRDGRYVRSISVKTGLTDGSYTEISGDGVKEGLEVITGEEIEEDSGKSQAASPFTPKFSKRPR